MSSDIELFKKSYPMNVDVGADLSAIPLKRNMQDPANQKAAESAWAAYRKRLGVPSSKLEPEFKDNLTRSSRELGRKYWGMPEERILELIGNEMGLSGALDYVQYDKKPKEWPTAFADTNPQAPAIIMPSLAADKEPERRFGKLFHEAAHHKAKKEYPTFQLDKKNQSNFKKYDRFGNQPKHFPPAMAPDRQMVEALEAEALARDYGGYPADIKPRSPWRTR